VTINPWEYSNLVFIPYLAAFILFLRRFHLRDSSGDHKRVDPFAPIALGLAGASLLPPITFVALRFAQVFILWGSVWFGALGCVLAAYAISLRRPRLARSTRPRRQQDDTARPRQARKGGSARRARP
jgi:hypothetical protein